MLIKRDFLSSLQASSSLEAVLLWGPRQVGKTTLLEQLALASEAFLDDLFLRQRAQNDPALFMNGLNLPCLIDEAPYAPNLFPEIKLRIDRQRRERRKGLVQPKTHFYLTGSNRLLLDKNVKESLAGRCNIYALHGLSVKEISAHVPDLPLKTILYKGGFPELYVRSELAVSEYLNAYISTFIEKDIAATAGIGKLGAFQTVLGLLAARTGQFIQISEIATAAGVDQKTVSAWIDVLQRSLIVRLVPPFFSNLSKRITKMKKFFFYDTALCARLQGHAAETLLWNSPHIGALFETLVFSEIVKTRDNFFKDWQLFTWRTKEQNEIDFVLLAGDTVVFMEAKLAIHGATPFTLDVEARKVFKGKTRKLVVTAGGNLTQLDRETMGVPLSRLGEFLLELCG